MIPGPHVETDGTTRFLLWAPKAERVELHVEPDEYLQMSPRDRGYFALSTSAAPAGSRYTFRVDGEREFPDPASSFQPDGVHNASQVVDHYAYDWSDGGYNPPALRDVVIYELHVGAFTPEGTLDAASRRLVELAGIGVNAVELMPLAQFPGSRNWGYDGVYPYAVQSSYGGPEALRRFVDAAHAAGIAVVLDVVYNHFGPEGNYSSQFGDYFTDRYRTPWGDAVNVDGPGSDEVRAYFAGNLVHWMERFHVDAFRLDAIHQIHDESAVPFLAELSRTVRRFAEESGRFRYIIAESDLNDRRVVSDYSRGGFGMDAAWSDDFHHAVHARLTGERQGYYADFGPLSHVARSLERGWSYAWNYSSHRNRRHGNDPDGLPTKAFVLCTQNHDQVGNRMLGERQRALVGMEGDRLARSLLLLAPYVPLLFMGQEYGEERPFLYFVNHGDAELLQATREGRRREFAEFHGAGAVPDPGAIETLEQSTLDWESRTRGDHRRDLDLTHRLLSLRREYDCFRPAADGEAEVARRASVSGDAVVLHAEAAAYDGLVAASFAPVARTLDLTATYAAHALLDPGGAPPRWRRVFALSEPDFGGPAPRRSPGETGPATEAAGAGPGAVQLAPFDVWAYVRERS